MNLVAIPSAPELLENQWKLTYCGVLDGCNEYDIGVSVLLLTGH
jgi:hypothetical protein